MSRFLLILLLFPTGASAHAVERKDLQPREPAANMNSFWRDPGNIRQRDLFYGPGGERDQPHGPFTFLKEDMDGTNPKFTVRDRDGVKWKVKLGQESRPETAASRLVWAAGYFADEDYFLSDFKVEKMQRLHRGRKFVSADGTMHNVRLKREAEGYKKTGDWGWAHDPFEGTREWNGLRVMMALINNWDLKDENNAIREINGKPVYLVSDLGASFGTTGFALTQAESKGNLYRYDRSHFIVRITDEYVSFAVPSRPDLIHLFTLPDYFRRVHMEWIGRRVPVADVHWIGRLLGQLSDNQVRAAFRAAGYDDPQIQGFAAVVERRIGQINRI